MDSYKYTLFCVWFFSVVISRWYQFLFFYECAPLYRCTTFCLSMHQLVDFGIIFGNYKWSFNVNVQLCVWTYVFLSLGFTSRSGMARSYGRYMFNMIRMPKSFSKAIVPDSHHILHIPFKHTWNFHLVDHTLGHNNNKITKKDILKIPQIFKQQTSK